MPNNTSDNLVDMGEGGIFVEEDEWVMEVITPTENLTFKGKRTLSEILKGAQQYLLKLREQCQT